MTMVQLLRKFVPSQLRPPAYLARLVRRRTGTRVAAGPFAGMNYITQSQGSAYIPKLLGIYERELHDCVEDMIQLRPDVLIDIGAAEGYYAVGIACRLPELQVVAYEMEWDGQEKLKLLSSLNDVQHRVEIKGKCKPHELAKALSYVKRASIICDVEGYEATLLDPELLPALRFATILVELHEFAVPRVTELLRGRFEHSHSIMEVWQEPRSRDEFPFASLITKLLPATYLDWAVSEWRPSQMSWLWMTPVGPEAK